MEDLRAQMQLHLNAMNTLAKGVWRLGLYRRRVVPGLSCGMVDAVTAYLDSVQSSGIGNPQHCLTCGTRFRSEQTVAGFSILTPGVDGDVASFVRGICLTCLQRPGLGAAIKQVYMDDLGMEFQITNRDASCWNG